MLAKGVLLFLLVRMFGWEALVVAALGAGLPALMVWGLMHGGAP
jgi:hypothetical protein